MMNEMLFLGGCPIIRPEGIYLDGRKVISLGIGDVGDLFAYRKEWEPFIAAHLALWRDMNNRFERSEFVTKCPPGIFKNEDIKDPDPVWRSWCASLALTRLANASASLTGASEMYVSTAIRRMSMGWSESAMAAISLNTG